ncbi:LOW QUALITY PROTEIN: zinc finger protein 414-like [Embiotoca jacksoni]|uniref:LOW QUALITY PROTEIN: zinc finger protein 414-like n=1 Tax=Embiotoca jacksoni TaxID=100190 RepID=UPI003704B44D
MMSPGSTVLQTPEPGDGVSGNKRMTCPLHGCKRVYTDASALESHVKEHEIPAQSVPGKVLLCSSVGCSGSFPSMQQLMQHMRHHHKPNIFFQCESCRTKLRSYRGLLTHLHTCSKVPRGKPKPAEPAPLAPDRTPAHIPHPDGSLLPAAPQPDPAAPHLLAPPRVASPADLPPPARSPQLAEVTPRPPEAPDPPPSLVPDGPKAAPDPPGVPSQHQTQTGSPEPVPAAPGSEPPSPPGPSAVWKKHQGLSCSRRVLWEHTRGRYTCVQCGHTVTNRKEMTQHINSQHSGSRAAEDTGST